MREHTVKIRGNTVKMWGKCGEDVRALFAVFLIALGTMPAVANATETLITGAACAIDGDSLIVGGEMKGGRCRGGDVEIRLIGIDAPEWDQTCGEAGKEWPCGQVATAAIRAMIDERDVTCRPTGRDRYKRTLATCAAGGQDIAARLMRDGLAVSYGGKYKIEEAAAMTAGAGIWAGPFMTPGQWRKRK